MRKGLFGLKEKHPKKIISPKQCIRTVNQYDLSKNYLATYSTIADAAKIIGISSCSISGTVWKRSKTYR